MQSLIFSLALILIGLPLSSNLQVDAYNKVVVTEPISADLADTLARVAWLSKLPMIAELAQPLPKIEIASGTYVLKDLLQGLVGQAPDYQWEIKGKVIHFYSRKLKEAKFNFLNLRFFHFAMPSNLSELKLTLPQHENALLQGSADTGILITGFRDLALAKDQLEPAIFENISGREVLLQAANERPTFFTIVVFPNSDPTKKEMERDINRNWFWQALSGQIPGPLYVQPPAGVAHK
jgi:hypothetical protein